MENVNTFLAKTISIGATSKGIIIPFRNCEYDGIEIGDTLKVMIKKVKEGEHATQQT